VYDHNRQVRDLQLKSGSNDGKSETCRAPEVKDQRSLQLGAPEVKRPTIFSETAAHHGTLNSRPPLTWDPI
ncbi:MAG: hypothetical protein ACR2H6_12650, partial [Pyrinomonadaceae bacterium]